MKTSSDAFVSDQIGFSDNVRSATTLVGPFVKQLSLFDGCQFGTLEILWKYYRSITNSNQRRHRVIQSQLAAAQATMCVSNGMQDTDVPFFYNMSVCLELLDENIETFVSVVETVYKNSFERQYIGFSVVGDSLVERKYLRAMFNFLVDLFPFVHSVLAMTVSSPRARGNLGDVSSFFDDGNAEDDNVTDDETSEEQKCDDEDMSDALSTKQRAILEFFIAKLWVRSQKNLKYWVMVSPLAAHSTGHIKNPPNHPLHGSDCTMVCVSVGCL
jgi:hypothetical protein